MGRTALPSISSPGVAGDHLRAGRCDPRTAAAADRAPIKVRLDPFSTVVAVKAVTLLALPGCHDGRRCTTGARRRHEGSSCGFERLDGKGCSSDQPGAPPRTPEGTLPAVDTDANYARDHDVTRPRGRLSVEQESTQRAAGHRDDLVKTTLRNLDSGRRRKDQQNIYAVRAIASVFGGCDVVDASLADDADDELDKQSQR